jgi:hypothetical protein
MDALEASVVAVAGRSLHCHPFSPTIKETASDLVEAFKAADSKSV